jgi:hypothetical protein
MITPDTPIGITTNYTPAPLSATNLPSFPEVACVEPGDRIMFLRQAFAVSVAGNNILADANGYFPHFVYRPYYCRANDPDGTVTQNNPMNGVDGNDTIPPTIRLDFQTFVCPWAGVVTIEGGAGPALVEGGNAAGSLEITWLWDRARRQRLRWWQQITNALGGARNIPRMPRVPVEATRTLVRHTLTMYNVAALTNLARPNLATDLRVPTDTQVILSFGNLALTTSNVLLEASSTLRLGPWPVITPTMDAAALEFGVWF